MVRTIALTAAMLISLLTPLSGSASTQAPSRELSCAQKKVDHFSMSFSLACEKSNISRITVRGKKKVCLYFFSGKEYVTGLHPSVYTGSDSSTSFEVTPTLKVTVYDYTGDFRCAEDR